MRKYGIENFYLEIIEECSLEELNEKEQYYIELYDSWVNGYNNGNSSNFLDGENNNSAKLTEKDIYNIRFRQAQMKENRKEIYQDYKNKITWSNFSYICKYCTWVNILPEYNTPEIMQWHKKQIGNEPQKFSLEDLEKIINLRKQGNTYEKIAEIFRKNRRTIERIFTGVYYKKEIALLKETKPFLFQNEGSTTIS